VELAAVVGIMQSASMGQAAALLVSGEAGVGKTVLVDAACCRSLTSPT
jgi:chromosomal replication initiation ATPase DnaA